MAAHAPKTKSAASAARSTGLRTASGRVTGIHAIEFPHHRGPHELAAFRLAALGIDLGALGDCMVDDLTRQLVQLRAAGHRVDLELACALEPVHAVKHFA